jgi:hypothetical protein
MSDVPMRLAFCCVIRRAYVHLSFSIIGKQDEFCVVDYRRIHSSVSRFLSVTNVIQWLCIIRLLEFLNDALDDGQKRTGFATWID